MASDIFDDVDAILAAEEGFEEDKNFNESELQDIMSEIEDLEKEFTQEEKEMSLQDKIEAELAMEMEMGAFEETAPEALVAPIVETKAVEVEASIEAAQPVAQVLSFEKPATPAPVATTTTTTSTSGVSFQAQGSMALNLDFKVGEESAKLTIDPVKGLVVTVSGVELCISEDSGCTVSMENGMKFTIPLSTQTNSLKKKAA
ncbi:hypothetical protein DOM21_15580 [Bacteriovorax stolpii]|uniref:Uncharacterized protein n=1 Tax=Bacteriovorax stolpii TaxID=960 RepID=A0A2K9NNW2_BACTC|nr:hypothetical protein [Bacteriovorax stolpii]AUN97216.1 hypothetical protein C0V70_03645 [Bacteriovorax stolpii]QDK42845.1 hypothetical protein DOM21_15580 [Bacteriovorax stolpii]TDP53505.1 hypothetical protein C8D79_2149 [Bacteriovorax stolpii]